MKMPTTTAKKSEAKPPAKEPIEDAAKQCLSCLEKKVRNLEKRKNRLELSQEKARKGTKLEKEQEVALCQYDQVAHDLEFARELHKQFVQITTENEKLSKKQAKREKAERQAQEIKRIGEILQLQSLLDSLGADTVREDFKTGKHGAVVLTQDNLNQLDELYQEISPSRDDSGDEYPKRLTTAADHLVNLLEGKDRKVVGTTYREIKELITLINGCGYFERARKATEEKTVVVESAPEVEQTEEVEVPEEDPIAEESEDISGKSDQQPMDLTVGTTDGAQSQTNLPGQPMNTREQDAFFAPSSTPYQAESNPQFNNQSSNSSRAPDFQSFTNNRPFQFIQTSYVMPDSDPAVIHAQPAVTSGLQFMSQGFDTSGGATHQVQASSQQQQQEMAAQQQQQQQHHHHTPQPQQQQPSAPAQDFNPQSSYSQGGLQHTENMFPAPPAVEEVSSSLPTHAGMMGQIRDESVSASSYEIPPSIPMPPSQQSQDQAPLDQQQQQQQQQEQQEKKFQMNASAPVFQSMYVQQVASAQGQNMPVSVPPPSAVPTVIDSRAQNIPQDFGGSGSAPNGDFSQSGGGDFQQNYQGNGFGASGYQRGGRGGFRGGRGGSGNGGPRGPGGSSTMQNGFSNRGAGSANANNRGGRGGYSSYPPNNGFRSENFQGGYNAGGGGFGNNAAFVKRGNMNNAGGAPAQNVGGFPRGGGNGRGGSGMRGGGMQRGGGPAGGMHRGGGAPRGGFNNRPMAN